MTMFNRIVGLFSRKPKPSKVSVVMTPPPKIEPTLRERVEDMFARAAPRGRLSATHCTSHRTVAMDLRDAKKRRNIAKRKTH